MQQPPAVQPPAAIEPITEEGRLTIFEETLLDPVIPPEPTPEEAKLTRLEQQLDPIIPPEPTREQVGTEWCGVQERLPGRLTVSGPGACPQSDPDPPQVAGAQQLQEPTSPQVQATETPTPTIMPVPTATVTSEEIQTPSPEQEASSTPTNTHEPTSQGTPIWEIAVPVPIPFAPLTKEQRIRRLEEQERLARLRQEQQERQAWLDSYWLAVVGCMDTRNDDREACIIDLGLMIYDHYDIDLLEVIGNVENNPIEEFDEFRMISDTVIMGWNTPAKLLFLEELGFDTRHYSNFEAAFFDTLRGTNPVLYLEMEAMAREHDAIQQYIDENAWEDIIGFIYGE